MRFVNRGSLDGQQRTLLERRQGIISLLVWLRFVERDPNGDKVLARMSIF